ncbi:MAG: hypothetical protein KGL39_05100 [Patescibacteria group bacterium]|nr:hypothetical protein [Patescibacteria group bacterium]
MPPRKFSDTIDVHIRMPRDVLTACEIAAERHGVTRTQIMVNAIQKEFGVKPKRYRNVLEDRA